MRPRKTIEVYLRMILLFAQQVIVFPENVDECIVAAVQQVLECCLVDNSDRRFMKQCRVSLFVIARDNRSHRGSHSNYTVRRHRRPSQRDIVV
jgi:hypothetical protein